MKLNIDIHVSSTVHNGEFYEYFVSRSTTIFSKHYWLNELTIYKR